MAVKDTVEDLTLLQQLRNKRSEYVNALATLIEGRQSERDTFEARGKDEQKPTDEERSAFQAAEAAFTAEFDQREASIKELDRRIAEQEIIEKRRQEAASASAGTSVSITHEPLTYRKDVGEKVSYFRDLAAIARRGEIGDPTAAQERLERHSAEMAVEMPKREAERERRAKAEAETAERDFTRSLIGEARGLESSPFEKRVNPNRTDGQGGYAIPPYWIMDELVPIQRAGRVASNLMRAMTLPEGTDSINLPQMLSGTIVGPQSDGAAVPSQDYTDTSVEAKVKTIAGQQDVAIQLLDQSPGNIVDEAIMRDLYSNYNLTLDRDAVYAPGSATKIKGIWPVSNWGGNTITSASAGNTGVGFFQTQGAMLSKLATTRFDLDNVHFLMAPRRWFWYATALDGASGTSGKPLVGDTGYGAFAQEALHAGTPSEGLVGRSKLGPFNYYASANCPTTDAATSTVPTAAVTNGAFDQVLAAKWDDIWLFEGAPRTRVLSEVLSGTLQVRFQLYNYVALLVRYGSSIVVAQGAGLPAPTGAIDTAMAF